MSIFVAKAELGPGERNVAAKSVEEQQVAVLFLTIRHKKCQGIDVNSGSVRGFFPTQTGSLVQSVMQEPWCSAPHVMPVIVLLLL